MRKRLDCASDAQSISRVALVRLLRRTSAFSSRTSGLPFPRSAAPRRAGRKRRAGGRPSVPRAQTNKRARNKEQEMGKKAHNIRIESDESEKGRRPDVLRRQSAAGRHGKSISRLVGAQSACQLDFYWLSLVLVYFYLFFFFRIFFVFFSVFFLRFYSLPAMARKKKQKKKTK